MTSRHAKMPTALALVPARSGSARIPDKNVRTLGGHPLIAYAIRSAIDSGLFRHVVVSTDSPEYAAIARHYGGEVPGLRPAAFATSTSPDIEWLADILKQLAAEGRHYDCFAILRPTSPFRKPETIQRAFDTFLAEEGVDSLRAVEPVREHPGKMWVLRGTRMTPLMPFFHPDGTPWHSSQLPSLPQIHVQNASLEIAWSRVVTDTGTSAGVVQVPFLTSPTEGFDLNGPEDWWYAEHLVKQDPSILPRVHCSAREFRS